MVSDSSSGSSSDPFVPIPSTKIPTGVDPKLFSILQQKVESLELTTNFIQQRADQKKIDLEASIISSKTVNSSTNKKIVEEIKKLNEKIDILEKQNIEKKIIKDKENMLRVKSLTADAPLCAIIATLTSKLPRNAMITRTSTVMRQPFELRGAGGAVT